MPDTEKQAIRDRIKQLRLNSSISYRETAANQVCARLNSLEQFRNAKHLALYYAINGELDLHPLWNHAQSQNKTCYFPVIHEEGLALSFLPATSKTPFKKNRFGIPEPEVSPDLAIPLEQLDLVLIPLVAFDVRCFRVGMGSGYYDHTFTGNQKNNLLGIGYQFQRVDHLEPDPWDIQLNAVITQRALYWNSD